MVWDDNNFRSRFSMLTTKNGIRKKRPRFRVVATVLYDRKHSKFKGQRGKFKGQRTKFKGQNAKFKS